MKITAGPYLQNVSRDSITVMWHTDEPGSSVVEYEANTRLGYSAYVGQPNPTYPERAAAHNLKTIHAVTLNGLRECWEYFYRVFSVASDGSSASSEGASFRTAPPSDAPFRFATYGDSMVVPEIHARIAPLARAYRPDLMVGSGDIVLDRIERCRGDFFEPAADLLRYTPWFATMGNHDSNTEAYTQFFSFPEPRLWFSFDYGCAHFTVLNSNMDYRPGSEQYAWLEQDLRAFRDARWKFVFFHHPPYCSNNCEIEGTRALCPLFESAGVDIVYNAHTTHYERFHPLRDGRYDPEGVVYVLTGGGGCETTAPYAQLWDHIHSFSAMAKSANFFVLTHVAPDEVTLRAIDIDDRVFDTFTLRKPPAPLQSSPAVPEPLPLPEGPPDGMVVAGFAEGPAKWVLPRRHFGVDGEIAHHSGASIRWRASDGGVTCPAVRRVLVDDGPAGKQVGGKAYRLSAWVKTEDVSGGVGLSVEWNGDMGFIDRVNSECLTGTNDWKELQVETPPLPGHVYAVRLLASASPGSTGTAWFDDVRIERI